LNICWSILHRVVKCRPDRYHGDEGQQCVMDCSDEKTDSFPQIGSFEQFVRRTV